MSVFNPKKRRPLSHGATRVLRAIVTISDREGRYVTLSDLDGLEPDATLLNRIHVLAERRLITVDGKRIRARQVARQLLGQPYYRDL